MIIEETPIEELLTYPDRIQALKDLCIRQGWTHLVKGFDSMAVRVTKRIKELQVDIS